jgi:DNA adenine methylase
MRYLGGKQRIAHILSSIINPLVLDRPYCEPFVGGGSIISKINNKYRVASDINLPLINMYKALSDGWLPPAKVSEEEYISVKSLNNPNDPLTAFVGFGLSFSGKYFGGYARDNKGRNYASNAANSLLKKMKGMVGVEWHHCDYRECPIPLNSVIYCDPPYKGTTQYGRIPKFDWDLFWDWCRMKQQNGHEVLVSEYSGPEDFEVVSEIQTKLDIRPKDKNSKRVEKVFRYRG